jgi:hypothetical protein
MREIEIDQRIAKRAAWILSAASERSSACEGITLHYDGYSEPGCDEPECGLIATGNWNKVTRWNRDTQQREDIDDTPCRVARLFEKLGIETEWEDEWTECCECSGLIRTEPDCYSWTRSYVETEYNGPVCEDCTLEDPEAYLESLEGNEDAAVTLDVDPGAYGYRKLNKERYETGFHPGQDASPKLVAKTLRGFGLSRFLFTLDSVGQFDAEWSVWLHKSEWQEFKAKRAEFDAANVDGPSNSARLDAYLRDVSRKSADVAPGPGPIVATENADGTANVRRVSPEQFLDGKALDS